MVSESSDPVGALPAIGHFSETGPVICKKNNLQPAMGRFGMSLRQASETLGNPNVTIMNPQGGNVTIMMQNWLRTGGVVSRVRVNRNVDIHFALAQL